MTETQADNCRAADLDMAKLGELVFRLPLASKGLRHTNVKSTLSYIHGGGLEMEFLKDLLTLKTQELIDNWYGGDEAAGRANAFIAETVVTSLFRRAREGVG